jgi:hypothetical protein
LHSAPLSCFHQHLRERSRTIVKRTSKTSFLDGTIRTFKKKAYPYMAPQKAVSLQVICPTSRWGEGPPWWYVQDRATSTAQALWQKSRTPKNIQ